MKTLIKILSLMCICCLSMFAQDTGSVQGSVIDEREMPMEFANVLLLNAADSSLVKGTISDSLGQFSLQNVPFNQYLISTRSIGFAPVYGPLFELSADNPNHDQGQMRLGESAISLDEVVVKSRKPTVELYADKLVMNVEDNPIATGNSALELLKQAPGVTVDHQDNISLKGQAGVLVIIDGKRSYLSNQEVAKMLDGMSGESVQKIEVIHNPSSKYDAEGTAGVINIVMMKDKNLGLNGRASLTLARGISTNRSSGLDLNYREKRFNLFGSYQVNTRNEEETLWIDRRVPTDEGPVAFDQRMDQIKDRITYSTRVGLDVFLSDKTTVGLLVNRRVWDNDSESVNVTDISGNSGEEFAEIRVLGESDNRFTSDTYNVNLSHAFDQQGHQLSIDADYSRYDDPAHELYETILNDDAGTLVSASTWLRSLSHSKVDIQALKLDYSRPFSESLSLETGLKASRVNTDNAITFEEEVGEWNWEVDEDRSNQFVFDEKIYAAYANLSTRIAKFDVQLGLRSEYTVSDGNSVTLDQQFGNEYLKFFPTLSLSHQVGEKHSLSYSYSKRIGRPNYESLNPFIYYLDQYTFSRGNPYLQPEFSHNFNVTHGFMNFIYTTFSYSRTNDAISELLEQDDESLSTFQTTRNFSTTDNLSLNISAPVPLRDWWMMRMSVSAWYSQFNSNISSGQLDSGAPAANVHLMNMFEIAEGLQAQTSTYYQSPLVWGIYDLKSQWATDVGVSKEVMKGRGELSFNVQDIFNTQQTRLTIDHGSIDFALKQKDETRRFQIGFSYNFGKRTVKKSRSRSTATEEEQNRVNSSN